MIRKPKEKIREYIAHRELRERQVLDALSDREPREVMAMVKKIYADVPEYLHPAAGKLGPLASEETPQRGTCR